MSFCNDCAIKGYSMCFCRPIRQPEIKFVSEIDTIKKLQEQNKILREALEYYAKRMGSGGTAREALAKVMDR